MLKIEKETIITYNEAEQLADIYTYNTALQRKLEKLAVKYPSSVKIVEDLQNGSKTYLVDKKLVAVNKPVEISDDVKKKKAKSVALARAAKKRHLVETNKINLKWSDKP